MDNNTIAISLANNKGKIIGRLQDNLFNKFEVEGENFYEGKLIVQRLSDNFDILPFTISEKLITAYGLVLEKDKELAFGGEFRSYNRLIDGKSRLILSFFVKEVLDETYFSDDNTNELQLTGYICKDPIYRVTPFNRQICDVLIAVNRPNFNKSDYIPCILWGRNAKFIQNQKIGTKISLIGRMQSRQYKKELSDGEVEERTAYEVSCQKVFIDTQTNNESLVNA